MFLTIFGVRVRYTSKKYLIKINLLFKIFVYILLAASKTKKANTLNKRLIFIKYFLLGS